MIRSGFSKVSSWSVAFVTLVVLLVAVVWPEYALVQQRKVFRPQFNDNFCLRAAAVYEITSSGATRPYPIPRISWIRSMLGDYAQAHLIYDPEADPDRSQLRRAQELFPEAKIWGWPTSKTLPVGVDRLEIGKHHFSL